MQKERVKLAWHYTPLKFVYDTGHDAENTYMLDD